MRRWAFSTGRINGTGTTGRTGSPRQEGGAGRLRQGGWDSLQRLVLHYALIHRGAATPYLARMIVASETRAFARPPRIVISAAEDAGTGKARRHCPSAVFAPAVLQNIIQRPRVPQPRRSPIWLLFFFSRVERQALSDPPSSSIRQAAGPSKGLSLGLSATGRATRKYAPKLLLGWAGMGGRWPGWSLTAMARCHRGPR